MGKNSNFRDIKRSSQLTGHNSVLLLSWPSGQRKHSSEAICHISQLLTSSEVLYSCNNPSVLFPILCLFWSISPANGDLQQAGTVEGLRKGQDHHTKLQSLLHLTLWKNSKVKQSLQVLHCRQVSQSPCSYRWEENSMQLLV